MNPDTIGWLVIAAVIITPVVGLVWIIRTRPVRPPTVSADAEFDLHVGTVPDGLITDYRDRLPVLSCPDCGETGVDLDDKGRFVATCDRCGGVGWLLPAYSWDGGGDR